MKNAFVSIGFSFGLFLVSTAAVAVQPNAQLTPGSLCTPSDPDFTGFRYAAHVAYCARNVSPAEKAGVAEAYGGIPEANWPQYEFDHLIPLNAGGSNHADNIWPQPLGEAHEKDKVEEATYVGLTNGTLTQEQAVQMIQGWIASH